MGFTDVLYLMAQKLPTSLLKSKFHLLWPVTIPAEPPSSSAFE